MIDFNKSALFIFLPIILLSSFNIYAQRYCGTEQHVKNDYINNVLQNARGEIELSDSLITIPVVFHILYNDSSENVEIEKVESQIDVLNEDFRRKNADTTNIWPQVADVGVEFCAHFY